MQQDFKQHVSFKLGYKCKLHLRSIWRKVKQNKMLGHVFETSLPTCSENTPPSNVSLGKAVENKKGGTENREKFKKLQLCKV